ncbi:caspase-1-like [Hylaeus volcanicus]|uniref:caspase-1-like n=1 Tax=Hylaeus volcanicus TaxID=313075 RepID=UPI0023B82247|nr:caspase-1-like [Hylaeus volcanicus]
MLGFLLCILTLTRTTIVYVSKRFFQNMDISVDTVDSQRSLDQVSSPIREHETDVVITHGAYEDEDEDEYVASNQPPIIVKLPVRKDDIRYKMNHNERGKCVILNHDTFESPGLKSRQGSGADVEVIRKTFSKLGFEVEEHPNYTLEKIYDKISELSKDDHSDRDCICVFILTHGNRNGLIYAKDYPFPLVNVWTPFTADKCPTLAGKPKLFFIQACRGSERDSGAMVYAGPGRSETDSVVTVPYKIPTHADFLFAHSTVEGFFSWRDTECGTWYIQHLCKVIEAHWEDTDLLKMLTITARTVANECSSTHSIPAQNNQKQMPSLTSTLTRDIFFKHHS